MSEFTPETLKKIAENGISPQIVEFLAWRWKLDKNDLDAIFEKAGIEVKKVTGNGEKGTA